MKLYSNKIIINGTQYINLVKANSYKEALAIQKERKRKSRNTFRGRLEFAEEE